MRGSGAQAPYRLGEGGGIAQRRAVSEADERGLERGQPARRGAVALRIGADKGVRLADAGLEQERVVPPHHVAAHEHAVGVAPVEGDVPRGVARGVEHGEAGDLVALGQHAGDLVRWGGRDEPTAADDHLAGLDRGDVVGAAPQRDPERVADDTARAEMVEVGVGERVSGLTGRLATCWRIRRRSKDEAGVDRDVAH